MDGEPLAVENRYLRIAFGLSFFAVLVLLVLVLVSSAKADGGYYTKQLYRLLSGLIDRRKKPMRTANSTC